MPGGIGGWSWAPDTDGRKLFMQFLAELAYCGDMNTVRQVARQFHTLAEIQWRKAAGPERQQADEGPE